jgi:hypothetical protein
MQFPHLPDGKAGIALIKRTQISADLYFKIPKTICVDQR